MDQYNDRMQALVDERDALTAQIGAIGLEWVANSCPYKVGQTVRVPLRVGSPDQGDSITITRIVPALQRQEGRWYWVIGGRNLTDKRKSIGGFREPVDKESVAVAAHDGLLL